MTGTRTVLNMEIKDVPLVRRGKVRNVYDLGENLLFVASDRISAFDVVMANGIPEKGKVLNLISEFWFDLMADTVRNHKITTDINEIISSDPRLEAHREVLDKRSMLVRKAQPLTVECIVRGYISGSGWKDYQKTGKICGIELPQGLRESDKLDEPIFTPSTKADIGHDVNITPEEARQELGADVFDLVEKKSVEIYSKARDYARERGIIIADTKFEFGKIGDEIILIDEMLTPDSSRFWPEDDYEPGRPQKSFDKQFVRDYLETIDWDKTPPGPELPEEIVSKTSEKYIQAYRILTGKEL
jgi:phosphoribosylaminoimidazole-succinocarboxamide synthase